MAVWNIKERNKKVRALSFRGATRAVCAGGDTPSVVNTIDFVQIESAGNATDFGDLISARANMAGTASHVRGVFGGGYPNQNVIQYITTATTGNTADFGDMTISGRARAGASNNIRGLMAGGFISGNSNVIDFITIASLGNATDFGDRTVSKNSVAGLANTTRAVFAGGSNPADNVIDFVQISTTGNAVDFGDLAVARLGAAGSNSSTKGLFSGGQPASPIEYISIGTLGNSVDFGDLATGRAYLGSTDNGVRSLTYAGSAEDNDSTKHNQIEQVQIASAGNAVDFGDATSARSNTQATISNGHGGLDFDFIQRPSVTALNRPGQTIGLFGGGNDGPAYLSSCEVVQVETLGKSSSFGDLTQTVNNSFSMSGNRTRGVRHSGYIGGSSPYTTNTMDYTEFASRGNFADFGDATAAGYGASRGPSTNDTRSFSMGFYNAGGNLTTVDYWAPSTLGNAADFGDLSVGSTKAAGMANTTRVIRYGSYDVNTIDYHAIASLGDFSDFGDAVAALGAGEAVSSPVRGVRCGAQSSSNTMEYITMATTGNGTDFGDLTVGRSDMGAASSHIRGVIFAGSGSPAIVNTIDYITIASAGNAADFGDASFARGSLAGMGNGHGGLA